MSGGRALAPSDAPLLARIADLRQRGAARIAPVRLAQAEAMARRLDGQPEAVRALLRARLESALDALAQRLPATAVPIPAGPRAPIRTAPRRRDAGPLLQAVRATPVGDELASAGRFRRVWSDTRAQERVAQAASQAPANAGPLNSHMLVLQALEQMRALPPDYLRRFVASAESLLWLQALELRAPRAASTATAAKTRRARR